MCIRDRLKTDEFADLYAEELKAEGGVISGEQFVDECQVESDLELLLPATYVTVVSVCYFTASWIV